MSFIEERIKLWRYLAAKKVFTLRESVRNALAAVLIATGNFVALDPSERRVLCVVWLLEGWPGRIVGKGRLLRLLGGEPCGGSDGSKPTSVALTVHRGRHRADPLGPKVALSCLYQRRTAREHPGRSAPYKHAELSEERVVWCVHREEKGRTAAASSPGSLLAASLGPRRALFRSPQAALVAYHSGAPRGCPWPLQRRFADGMFLDGSLGRSPEVGEGLGMHRAA